MRIIQDSFMEELLMERMYQALVDTHLFEVALVEDALWLADQAGNDYLLAIAGEHVLWKATLKSNSEWELTDRVIPHRVFSDSYESEELQIVTKESTLEVIIFKQLRHLVKKQTIKPRRYRAT